MSDIYREFGVDVLRDSENAGPTAAEVRMAQEIERLRAENNHLRRVGMDRPSAGLHKAAMAELRSENHYLRKHRHLDSICATDARAEADKLRAENERLRVRVEVLEKALGNYANDYRIGHCARIALLEAKP